MNYFLINNSIYLPTCLPSYSHPHSSFLNFDQHQLTPNFSIQYSPNLFCSEPSLHSNNSPLSFTVPHQVQNQENSPIQTVRLRKKRQKNEVREKMSAKKNSESNIINHFFGFFTAKECSEIQLRKVINSQFSDRKNVQKIISVLLYIFKVINLERGKKYMNVKILLKSFKEQNLEKNMPEIVDKLLIMGILSLKKLSRLLRKCFYQFIMEDSLTSILTSKRISLLSKQIHLMKRRKIIELFHKNPFINDLND